MSAAFVGETQMLPDPEPGFPLEVNAFDGEPSLFVRKDGGAEVLIIGPRNDDKQRLVVLTAFETIDQADRAWRVLHDAFAEVTAIQDETVPTPDDGHEHRERLVRFSRTIPQHRICELCGANLGEIMPKLPELQS